MIDQEMLLAISQIMDQKLEAAKGDLVQLIQARQDETTASLKALREDVRLLQEDVNTLKENTAVTRYNTNLLLRWAERADKSAINIGLYDDDNTLH